MGASVNGCFLDRKALGQAIKKQRKLFAERPPHMWSYPNGFTQQDLCDRLNDFMDAQINVKTLSRIETGKQEPSFSLIVQIAFLLGGAYWRATLCEMVEESIVGDPETDKFAWMKDVGDTHMIREGEEKAAERIEKYFELEAQMRESMEQMGAMLLEMNKSLSSPQNALMQKQPQASEALERFRQMRKATPAPPQGAVAIDEPQGKEHDHEQD